MPHMNVNEEQHKASAGQFQFVDRRSGAVAAAFQCAMYRIMYELAVCSDGMTEALCALSDIMHTHLLTSAAVVRTRAPEYEENVVW